MPRWAWACIGALRERMIRRGYEICWAPPGSTSSLKGGNLADLSPSLLHDVGFGFAVGCEAFDVVTFILDALVSSMDSLGICLRICPSEMATIAHTLGGWLGLQGVSIGVTTERVFESSHFPPTHAAAFGIGILTTRCCRFYHAGCIDA